MASMEFVLEEATIDDLHKAIREGRTTCTQVVQRYIERCQRYNGVATLLVTADGAPVPNGLTGSIRAHNPLAFPTHTIPVSEVLPDFHHYQGPPWIWGTWTPQPPILRFISKWGWFEAFLDRVN